jgi:hypothetical protein
MSVATYAFIQLILRVSGLAVYRGWALGPDSGQPESGGPAWWESCARLPATPVEVHTYGNDPF